jgi:hypothetical protein
MTTTDVRRRTESVPNEIENTDPHTPMGLRTRGAKTPSGGAAYATAAHLDKLADYLRLITTAVNDTGWHAPAMLVSFGEVEAESIVVGVRWINGEYHAEIR